MNSQKEKMIKVSKLLSIVLKVCAIIFTAMISLLFIYVIISPALDFEFTREQIDFLSTTPEVPFGDVDGLRAWLIDIVLGTSLIIAVLFIASSIFKAISRDGTPFIKKNSDKIRIIALLLLANEIVISPLQMLVTMIFFPEVVASTNIALINIIVAAMFFCLALIFDYGRQLQQESDELL